GASCGLRQQVLDCVTLFGQFLFGGLHAGTGEIIDLQALDDFPVTVLADAREGVDQAFLDAVGTVAVDAHGNPVAVGGAECPAAHVVNGGVGSRCSRGCATCLDDGGATLLYFRDVGVGVPVGVDLVHGYLAIHQAVVQVWVLGAGVVAPDGHLLDVVDGLAELVGQLRHATVVVEAGHGGELARVDVRRVALGDQGVGVGRVADYQHLDVTAGHFIDRLALYREDGGVGFQQILALHARAARTRTDQQG